MLTSGQILKGRYRIVQPIGAGGQSRVYLAEDMPWGGQKVVVKELIQKGVTPDEQADERYLFQREGELLMNLSDPHLPKIHEIFQEGAEFYLAEELIQGETLQEILERAGPLPEEEVCRILFQLLEALEFLHGQSPPVLVRDIKPSNIMLARDGRVMLIDFSIARLFVKGKSDTVKMGSPGYAPPEQYKGLSEPSSDIYAAAVTALQALTGHDPTVKPFSFPTVASLNPQASPRWDKVLAKALSPDPRRRYRTAEACAKALLPLARKLKTGAPAQRRPGAPRRAASRVPVWAWMRWVLVALAVVVLGAGVFIAVGRLAAKGDNDMQCERNVGRLGEAVKAYMADHGPPPDLDALVPRYIEAIPACPVAGRRTYAYKWWPSFRAVHIRCDGTYHWNGKVRNIPSYHTRYGVYREN